MAGLNHAALHTRLSFFRRAWAHALVLVQPDAVVGASHFCEERALGVEQPAHFGGQWWLEQL